MLSHMAEHHAEYVSGLAREGGDSLHSLPVGGGANREAARTQALLLSSCTPLMEPLTSASWARDLYLPTGG